MFSTQQKVEQNNAKSPLLKKKSFRLSDAAFYSWIAAILAVFVLYVVYLLQMQTVAGGTNTVMRMDLYHQYGPLYAEFYDRLVSGESLIYSWNTGLGSSFLGNLFNYCCSPFTLLILLFGHYYIPESIALIILFKASAAAFAFTFFVNKVYGSRKTSIAFGLLYAFSGYFVAYSWNVMWLDAFLMFPIVMLGITYIIRKGKPAVYIAALTYTMITNYYMAYMVCILSVIYFLYYYFSYFKITSKLKETPSDAGENGYLGEFRNSRFMAAGFKFALSSFLSFMLAAFALLPVYFILTGSSATNSSGAPQFSDWKEYFNIFDFLVNHLANLEPTIRSSGEDVLPNIYCGVMTLFLVPAFLFSKHVSKKRKALTCGLIVFFYASFVLNFLNYFWHGMHYPNDLPYRYSFAYSFILLSLAYEAFLHIKEYSEKFFLGTGVALLAFIVLVQELGSKNIGEYTLMVNIAFVIVFTAVLTLIAAGRFKKETASMLLVCLILCELTAANVSNYVMSQSKDSYASDYYDFQDISAAVDAYEAENDNELFFREERSRLLTRMDASWLDYNGISIFSSMAYESTSKMQRQLGLFSNGINSYTYNPQTAVYNSMFGLKYIYDKNNLLQSDTMYSHVTSNDTFDAFEYNYYLPLAFSVSNDMSTWADYGGTNPFINQNRYFELATGVADVLENVTAQAEISTTAGLTVSADNLSNGSFRFNAASSEGTATVTFLAEEAGEYCVYFKTPNCIGYNITADNGIQTSTRYASGSTVYFSLNVGYLEAGQSAKAVLSFPADKSGTTNIYCVRLNEDKFTQGYNQILRNGTLNITRFEETTIEGTINVTNENALLYTSIPYDESWKITIDGIEVADEDITPISDALLAVKISQGEHNILFSYEARGLKIGVILSLAGALITILLLLFMLISKRKYADAGQIPSFFLHADDTQMHTFEDNETDEDIPVSELRKQKSVLWRICGCYLTLGLYYFAWKYSVYNDVINFTKTYGDKRNECNGLLLLFAPVYAPYWIASRSVYVAKCAAEYGIKIEVSFAWRFVLALLGGGFFALGELEDDLNFFYAHIEEAKQKAAEQKAADQETVEQEVAEQETISATPEENTADLLEDTVMLSGFSPAVKQSHDETQQQTNEKQYSFTKKSDFFAKIISIGIVFFFILVAYLGLALGIQKWKQDNAPIVETTQAVTTTATTTTLITVPDTSATAPTADGDSQTATDDSSDGTSQTATDTDPTLG